MKTFIFCLMLVCGSTSAFCQIDTVSYPQQRKEILELLHRSGPGVEKSCGDLVAVGPKGDISFSRKEWVAAQSKEKVVFKGIKIVPGSEVIRIYDGTVAVVNLLINVSLQVDGRDVQLKVRRMEVYHKTTTAWCMVAGQGTEVDEKLFPVKAD